MPAYPNWRGRRKTSPFAELNAVARSALLLRETAKRRGRARRALGSRLDLSYPEESQFLRLTEPIEWEKCNEVLSLRDFGGSDYQCIRSSYARVCRRRWCRRTLCRRGWNIKSMEAEARSTAAGLRSG